MSFQNRYFNFYRASRYPDSWLKVPRRWGRLNLWKKLNNWNVIFILIERLSSSYFMPGCYFFVQLSFAIQKIIQFLSDMRGGWKIEITVQGAPLSPTHSLSHWGLQVHLYIYAHLHILSLCMHNKKKNWNQDTAVSAKLVTSSFTIEVLKFCKENLDPS